MLSFNTLEAIDWVDRNGEPGTLPDAWRFTSTTFHLTPLARCLRQDVKFSLKALGASLGAAYEDSCG